MRSYTKHSLNTNFYTKLYQSEFVTTILQRIRTQKTIPVWTSDIFVIKRTALQLLAEFIGRQKIRLISVGVSRIRGRDVRQTLITDF